MQKICPYCGRAGELGSSCPGCGYVLQANDEGNPQQEPVTVHRETHTVIRTEIRQNFSPQAGQMSQTTQTYQDSQTNQASQSNQTNQTNQSNQTNQNHRERLNQPNIHNSTENTNTVVNSGRTFFTLIIRILGYIVSIPLLLFGILAVLFTLVTYKEGFFFGMTNTLISLLFIILGAIIINSIRPPSKKLPFGKQLKYLLLLDFILTIVCAIIWG